MIKFIFSIVLMSCTMLGYSQDIIVTSEGDTLNCKITKVRKDNIFFIFKNKEKQINTLLPVSNVIFYSFNYFKKSEISNENIMHYGNYQHFRIALNGGYSYQTAKISESVPSDFKNYINELKSGYHIGIDFTYYFSEPLGFGFKLHQFITSNHLDYIYIDDGNGNRRYGKMSDDLKITFLGPSFSTRIFNGNKNNAFFMNMSLGYMIYENEKVVIDNYRMNGNTIGFDFDIGYDIFVNKNFKLGFQLSYITGFLYKYDWYDGKTTKTISLSENEYESLNRLDLSIGFRFNK